MYPLVVHLITGRVLTQFSVLTYSQRDRVTQGLPFRLVSYVKNDISSRYVLLMNKYRAYGTAFDSQRGQDLMNTVVISTHGHPTFGSFIYENQKL